ncbi:phage repressor protein/antirepressor Ant [Melissococcus plutonius]|uniref:Phage antirepressor protein n=1 Tax=Melissococcus plutonius (strain ATCC 35311 / DSM 29964 / CIP 104052 / LMG 20360 / NCIMB 702443) TaxID=940190 RepID=F3YBJ5_MELPT|nr:phage repressor protein/antirepressor Ant [Melissococcus plutonius]KMT33292.1 phage antirepressor protein [Melissococcus plutonius]KMT33638.1 phage antirepressor protein [Melissococcus plutonius]KMT38999.1 phage antirepressor protein [Melissococcus plutonius]MBB5177527.1 anti-repressor protein [Melissococcus plutonius]BAK21873.1 phage antirepressor protein [Melissococcus plutonius ATCC 35311]
MNELQIFNFEQNEVRTILVNDEPYFIGKDVAKILGYERTDNAVRKHVEDEDRLMHQISASGQNRNMIFINESGLYSLILSSKMPNAKKFKRWVTSEVLPSIRKNGMYMTDQKAYDVVTNPNSLADLLQQASDQLKQKDLTIQELKPKALFADSVSASHTSILVGELAKLLKQNGVDMGQNKLFAWLRDNGYLIRRKGTDYNMPTQRSMEMELFEIKETSINRSNGTTSISKTPKVTGKGQVYFVNKFCREIA